MKIDQKNPVYKSNYLIYFKAKLIGYVFFNLPLIIPGKVFLKYDLIILGAIFVIENLIECSIARQKTIMVFVFK